MSEKYNWNRCWYSPKQATPIDAHGYLDDGNSMEKRAFSIKELSHKGCLILLGEPGSGKSNTLVEAYLTDCNHQVVDSEDVQLLDLRSISSRETLEKELFKQSYFQSWLDGSHTLTLYIDSFDESLMQFEALVDFWIENFRKYQRYINRLKLRIACRSGIWIDDLCSELKKLWTEKEFDIYNLAPLKKQDVIQALKHNGIKPEIFLEEASNKGIISFLVKPVTLNFILDGYYNSDEKLPESQIEIYEKGCRLYCSEVNQKRGRKRSIADKSNEEQKYEIASQIAVLMILTNRSIINIGQTFSKNQTNELGLHEIRSSFPSIEKEKLIETLRTGLFTTLGGDRFRWSHLTFAEYLASAYLSKNVNVQQMSNILFHPDVREKVIPQLHAIAGWLAGMNEKIFDLILNNDYQVLLLCDFSQLSFDQRLQFVNVFLMKENSRTTFLKYNNFNKYSDFYHPAIEDQIRRFLIEKLNQEKVLKTAISIAVKCDLKGLQNDYLKIIEENWNDTQSYALIAFLKNASSTELSELKQILQKGSLYNKNLYLDVLNELNKHRIVNVSEWLSVVFRLNFVDGIEIENLNNMLKDWANLLNSTQLAEAFQWIEKQYMKSNVRTRNNGLNLISDLFLIHISARLKDSDKLKTFWVQLLNIRTLYTGKCITFKEFNLPLKDQLDNSNRRFIMEKIIKDKFFLNVHELEELAFLLKSCDASWLHECTTSSQKAKETNRLRWLMGTIGKKHKVKARNSPRYSYDSVERLKPFIAAMNTEDKSFVESWIRFTNLKVVNSLDNMIVPRKKHQIYAALCKELEIKNTLLNAAFTYLKLFLPSLDQWIDFSESNKISAGRIALLLLFEHFPDKLKELPYKVWEAWLPGIIEPKKLHISDNGQESIERNFQQFAVKLYPILLVDVFLKMVDKMKSIQYFVSDFCYVIWNDQIGEGMLSRIRLESYEINKMESLLCILLEKDYKEAIFYAHSLLKLPLPAEGKKRERCIVVARRLMTHASDGGWNTVWDCMKNNIKFGNEVLQSFASTRRENLYLGAFLRKKSLTPEHLGDFYIWIELNLRIPEGWNYNAYETQEWKQFILELLRDMKTEEAYAIIRKLADLLPECDDAIQMWSYVQNDYLLMTWNPPQADAVSTLLRNNNAKLVSSVQMLMDAVIESLNNLDIKLQGVTPTARFLWDKYRDGTFHPKDENDLSNYVKSHLEDDLKNKGIISNREVEIRRIYGGRKGERPDIIVQAISREQDSVINDTITIIIEVKGCWHKEVDSAMENQLLDRYLKDNEVKGGLYLVGWFFCSQWETSKESLQEAKKKFHEQAEQLTASLNGEKLIRSYVLNAALR
jgi:hypothetical protein